MTPQELHAYFTALADGTYLGTGLGMTCKQVAAWALDPYDVIPHYVWQDLLQFTDVPREVLAELARQRTG